jgi:hypothetical protein
MHGNSVSLAHAALHTRYLESLVHVGLPQAHGVQDGAILVAQEGGDGQQPLPQPPLAHAHLPGRNDRMTCHQLDMFGLETV